VTNGAGAPQYPQDMKVPWAKSVKKFSSEHHWVLVQVTKKKLTFTVYSDSGEVLDKFTAKRRKKLK